MKKTLLTIIFGVFGIMAIATPALATTSVSLTPVNVSVNQGQVFTLTIGTNPEGAKNYTAKIELHYPVDILEVKSFAFANGWTALSQSGYDLIDNTNGILIKTAGYPGGISSPTTFGTVSFLAKKSANGTITLNSNSFVLDAKNQNVLIGASVQTAVVISVPALATAPTQTTLKTPMTSTVSVFVPKGENPTVNSKKNTFAVEKNNSSLNNNLVATVLLSSFGNLISNRLLVSILVILLIILYILEVFALKKKEKKEIKK